MNPEGAMPALPEKFLEQFRCGKCKKYLRPPIKTVCNKGHMVCGICLSELLTNPYSCPVYNGCQRVLSDIEAVAVETMIKVSIIKCMWNLITLFLYFLSCLRSC